MEYLRITNQTLIFLYFLFSEHFGISLSLVIWNKPQRVHRKLFKNFLMLFVFGIFTALLKRAQLGTCYPNFQLFYLYLHRHQIFQTYVIEFLSVNSIHERHNFQIQGPYIRFKQAFYELCSFFRRTLQGSSNCITGHISKL